MKFFRWISTDGCRSHFADRWALWKRDCSLNENWMAHVAVTRQARCSPTLEPTKVTEMITSGCHDNRVWASCRLRRRERRRAPVPRSDDAPDRGGKTAIRSAASATQAPLRDQTPRGRKRPSRSCQSFWPMDWARAHGRRPPKGVFLGMDFSVSPTHGEQKNRV